MFTLTAYEAPPDRRRYEIRTGNDAAPWRRLTPREFAAHLEAYSAYPDEDRARIEAGEVVQLKRYRDRLVYVRRSDSTPDRRQLPLL